MMQLRQTGFVALLSLGAIVFALPAQDTPKAPPTGARRDPGIFGTGSVKKDKKDRQEDENTRAVGGVVRNEADEIVEGAVVQLKDTKSLKIRSYITKADGIYKFFGLSTNADYELRADFKGSSSEKRVLSIFDGRKEAIVNLKLAVPAAAAKKDEKPEAAAAVAK